MAGMVCWMQVCCGLMTASAQPGGGSPTAVADQYTALQDTVLSVAAAGVLVNDTDPEYNVLTAVLSEGPAHGSLTLAADGGFLYQPETGYLGEDAFTYLATDGETNSEVVTVTISVVVANAELLSNGSFESDLGGWTASGNLSAQTGAPYTAFDGVKLVSFNDTNRTPNGVLSRSFRTVPGYTYNLRFEVGTFSYVISPQKLKVTVDGATALVNEVITITGAGGGMTQWQPRVFTFIADRPSCTLTFRDQSAGTSNIDLLLDHVRVTGPPSENIVPVAEPDQYAAVTSLPLVVAAPGVVANDTDGNTTPLTASLVSGPAHGTLVLNPDGGFTYTAESGFFGADSFVYQANDGDALSDPVTVSLVVTLHDAPPTAIGLTPGVVMENGLAGSPAGILTATDADIGDLHTFTFIAGAGDTDNAGFLIHGNALTLRFGALGADGNYFDFETNPRTFSVRIRATDVSGRWIEVPFILPLGDDRSEDADADGLSEEEEEDIHGSSDTDSDTDGDGYTDRSEVIGGSSPTDSQAWPDSPLIAWGLPPAGASLAPHAAPLYQLTTGQQHSLGLTTNGGVAAWAGWNTHGQITVPPGLADVVAIAAGGDFWVTDSAHSLALKSDGTVVAWGCDLDGQVTVPAGLSGVTRIAAGRAHSLALKGDGTVVAWGCNLHGQCVVPAGLGGVVDIAAGGFYSMALKSDGTVVTWGDNFNGITWESAAAPAGLRDVVALAAGRYHMLALRSDGTVVAWGYDLDGQATPPAGLTGVTAVAAGGFHSLALKSDGSMVAWGSDSHGQCTIPTAAQGQVKAISAGLQHSLALRQAAGFPQISSPASIVAAPGEMIGHTVTVSNAEATGYQALGLPPGLELDPITGVISGSVSVAIRTSVYLVADTDRGRLTQALWIHVFSGESPTAVVLTPPEILENSQAGTVVGLLTAEDPDAGEVHGFELVGGEGAADNARFLISGGVLQVRENLTRDFELDPAPYQIRVRVSDTSLNSHEQVISIDLADNLAEDADQDGLTEEQEALAGTGDNDADSDNDGFGDGFESVRGTSPTDAGAYPADPLMLAWGAADKDQTEIPDLTEEVLALAAGWGHNLALLTSGGVRAWGWNEHGQCDVPENLTGVVALEAGDYHSLALRADGTVVAWGGDEFGQATVPENLSDVIAVAAGSYHSLALKSDGTVTAWGDDENQQATVPENLTDVVAIAAGGYHNLALKRDGTVVAWGAGWSGATEVPPGLEKIIGIAAGGFHSLALRADGGVIAWGANEEGQSSVPPGLADVAEIGAGWLHGTARKHDGTLVSWGSGARGQAAVPAEAVSVRSMATGDFHHVALRRATGFPEILTNSAHQSWPGDAVSHPVGVSGAVAGSYRAAGLPSGLVIDPQTGLISGIASAGERRVVRVTAETDKGRLTRLIWMNTEEGRAPVSIEIASAPVPGGTVSVMENSLAGTAFATLSAVDPDAGDTHIYQVRVTGGSSDPYLLEMSGSEIRVSAGASIDFETPGQQQLVIRAWASDSAGHFTERSFNVLVLDDRTEDADGDGLSEALEEDYFHTSDSQFTHLATLDTDRDGLSALVEYAFNLNPSAPDAGHRLGGAGSTSGLPVAGTITDGNGNRRLKLEYLRRIGGGMTYVPQFTSGLGAASWTDATQAPVVTPVTEEWERCVVEDQGTFPARFGRIRVTR
jgi:alpha-tubulin suppressor-like RCC1 family protein